MIKNTHNIISIDTQFSAFLDSNLIKENYCSILALNGEIPNFPSFMKSLPIIAVDGG